MEGALSWNTQEASPPFLPLGFPPTISSARDQAGVTALQQPQPLPACLAVCSLVQATVGSRFKTLAPTPHPLLCHLSPPRLASPFSLTTFRTSPGRPPQQPALPAAQSSGSLQPSDAFRDRQAQPSKPRSQASAFHLSASSPPSLLFLLILTFVLPFPCASPLSSSSYEDLELVPTPPGAPGLRGSGNVIPDTRPR